MSCTYVSFELIQRLCQRGQLITFSLITMSYNTLVSEQNGWNFADDFFSNALYLNKITIFIQIPLEFVPKFLIDNKSALVQVMAWSHISDKPLSEPMMTQFSDAHNEASMSQELSHLEWCFVEERSNFLLITGLKIKRNTLSTTKNQISLADYDLIKVKSPVRYLPQRTKYGMSYQNT